MSIRGQNELLIGAQFVVMSYDRSVTHRVISDRVHRLLVTLSYFRPDRFVQLLSLIPILILLLYYLVSGCLTSLC